MKIILITFFVLRALFVNAQIISTVAGTGSVGYSGDGTPATSATIGSVGFLVFDRFNNYYFTELNNTIRKVSTSGIITTVAGNGTSGYSGDGFPATTAQFNFTGGGGMAFDSVNNLYIADQANNRIRKVDAISGIVTTIAGTGVGGFGTDGVPATAALLNSPVTVTFDTAGNLYILDGFNYKIREINTAGIISTIAGTGTMGYSGDGGIATTAEIYAAGGMRVGNNNFLYIADGIRIRKIDLTSDTITLVAGNGISGYSGDGGPATAAQFYNTMDVVQDGLGNLYISDRTNNRVREVDPSGIITTAAGDGTGAFSGDGLPATAAQIYSPRGVAIDACGSLYIADNGNDRIRKVSYPPILTTPIISLSGIITAPAGTTVTVTATVANAGSSYLIHWMNHGIEFTTTTIPSVTYTKAAGIDTITARVVSTATYGCYDSTTSAGHVVTTMMEGVVPLGKLTMTVYPNPADDMLHIDGLQGAASYRLLNMVGSVMGEGALVAGNNSISVAALPQGVYMLEVNSGAGERTVSRILKE